MTTGRINQVAKKNEFKIPFSLFFREEKREKNSFFIVFFFAIEEKSIEKKRKSTGRSTFFSISFPLFSLFLSLFKGWKGVHFFNVFIFIFNQKLNLERISILLWGYFVLSKKEFLSFIKKWKKTQRDKNFLNQKLNLKRISILLGGYFVLSKKEFLSFIKKWKRKPKKNIFPKTKWVFFLLDKIQEKRARFFPSFWFLNKILSKERKFVFGFPKTFFSLFKKRIQNMFLLKNNKIEKAKKQFLLLFSKENALQWTFRPRKTRNKILFFDDSKSKRQRKWFFLFPKIRKSKKIDITKKQNYFELKK
jgi:hypothetical protein